MADVQWSFCAPVQSDVRGAFRALLQTLHSQTRRGTGETNAKRQVQWSSRRGYATTGGCKRDERETFLFLARETCFVCIPLKAQQRGTLPGLTLYYHAIKSESDFLNGTRALVLDHVKSVV